MSRIAVFVENRPFFGALLVHVPLLHALRERHAGARLVLFAPFDAAGLLVRLGCADEAVRYDGRFADVSRRLRTLAPERLLVLRPASRWLDLAAAGSGARERLGFDSWLARLAYTRRAPHDTAIYRPRKYLTLLGGRAWALAQPLDRWFRDVAAAAPTAHGAELAILPGGGAGAFKLWGSEHFIALAARLAADDPALRFAWVLGPQEAALRERIEASPVGARSRCLVDRPVAELAALAFAARGAVGNDCGPGHVFQMCGCPFACVMSDHDGGAAVRIAEWIDAPNREHAIRSAPGESIDRVPVEAVAERVRSLLAAPDRRGAGSQTTGAEPAKTV